MGTKSEILAKRIEDKLDATTMLSRRYVELYQSEKYYDIIFEVEDSIVKCHKLILSAASPVFEAMFFGPIKEQQQRIEILDIAPDAFNTLIKYIYSGTVDFEQLNLLMTIELYYGAEKYLLTELITKCLEAIKQKLRFSNIIEALELSVELDLSGLLEVCMSFFMRCCLSDSQYLIYLKQNYVHASKECIKKIIAACGESPPNHLLFFVNEWSHQECEKLGLQKDDCAMIIDELDFKQALKQPSSTKVKNCITIERCYYRACRPFCVDVDAHEWKLSLKINRFISLHGLIMASRLRPSMTNPAHPNEYIEHLDIEISVREQNASLAQPASSVASDSEEESEHEIEGEGGIQHRDRIIWRHTISKQTTKYNCDFNIRWNESVILAPDKEYMIKLKWPLDQSHGAEYPCSFQSNLVDGIQFIDLDAWCSGSIIKGLHYVDLVYLT